MATLNQGAISPGLRQLVTDIWRSTSRAKLTSALGTTMVVAFVPLGVFWLGWTRYHSLGALLIGIIVTLVFASCFAIWPVRQFFRYRKDFNDDLAAGQVIQTQGEIVWKRDWYEIRFPGANRSSAPTYRAAGILPGRYHFFFLPRSGFLVMSERQLFPSWQPLLTDVLGQAQGFTATDLDANRAGRMSSSQTKRLWRNTAFSIFVLLLMLIWCLLSANLALKDGRLSLLSIPWLAVGIIPVAIGAFITVNGAQLWRDALKGSVNKLVGEILLVPRRSRFEYHIAIAGQYLSIRIRTVYALVDKVTYAVHFAPHSRRILSIEPLEETKT